MPKTYDPIVSTIPVAIKTSANSFESTNLVKFDRIIAMTTKNKQPIETAIHKKNKSIEILNQSSYQDKASKPHELYQKE